METVGTTHHKLTLSRRTAFSSFRLRCPSLNSLRLRRIFDVFDKNHDSVITVDELSQALKLLGLETDLSELVPMVDPYIKPGNAGLRFEDFEALHQSLNDVFFGGLDEGLEEADERDQDGEGCNDYEGSVGVAEAKKASREETELSEAFKVFDEDGDGYISARELQVVLGKLGLPEGREIGRVEKMISCVDRDHDGRVDFFEFKDMMRSVTVRTS